MASFEFAEPLKLNLCAVLWSYWVHHAFVLIRGLNRRRQPPPGPFFQMLLLGLSFDRLRGFPPTVCPPTSAQ